MAKRRTQEELRKERFDVANKFSDAVVKKLGPLVKSIVTWGSITRKQQSFHKKSDIDCVVIVDDTATKITDQLREKMDMDVRKIAHETDTRISVQPVWLLTEFWDMIRTQSPLAYSVLREGWALYDTGFFVPTRKLYELGRFPATSQAAYMKMDAVPRMIMHAESLKLMIVFDDLFYAMLEAAQAVIMFV
jgi:predicted nucleotidyltransferase